MKVSEIKYRVKCKDCKKEFEVLYQTFIRGKKRGWYCCSDCTYGDRMEKVIENMIIYVNKLNPYKIIEGVWNNTKGEYSPFVSILL